MQIKKSIVAYIALTIIATVFVLKHFSSTQMSSMVPSNFAYGSSSGSSQELQPEMCVTSSAEFKLAMELQKASKFSEKTTNGTTDVKLAWRSIPAHFNVIWETVLGKLALNKVVNSRDKEEKYFVGFSRNLSRPYACNFVTLGVGGSVDAEKQLMQTYPDCRLLAVDPSAAANKKLVTDIGGTFLETAVGGKTGANQPTNTFETGKSERTQIGIFDFLRQLSINPVDLMLIDVEGSEFGIIEQFVENAAKMPRTVCQLNMEVHFPHTLDRSYSYERFYTYLNIWLRSGRFALMKATINDDGGPFDFLRFFLVNVDDRQCVRKFLC